MFPKDLLLLATFVALLFHTRQVDTQSRSDGVLRSIQQLGTKYQDYTSLEKTRKNWTNQRRHGQRRRKEKGEKRKPVMFGNCRNCQADCPNVSPTLGFYLCCLPGQTMTEPVIFGTLVFCGCYSTVDRPTTELTTTTVVTAVSEGSTTVSSLSTTGDVITTNPDPTTTRLDTIPASSGPVSLTSGSVTTTPASITSSDPSTSPNSITTSSDPSTSPDSTTTSSDPSTSPDSTTTIVDIFTTTLDSATTAADNLTTDILSTDFSSTAVTPTSTDLPSVPVIGDCAVQVDCSSCPNVSNYPTVNGVLLCCDNCRVGGLNVVVNSTTFSCDCALDSD